MPGIEDLMNIRTQGGTENAPMGMPPGMPPQGGAPMGMPPQGGAPMPPPPPQMAGMPPDMGGMSPEMGGMPPDMGGMPPEMGEQAPVSVEEDAVSLAEAVIERANGDPQAAVAILDTAANMILQSTEGGGGMPPGPDMGGMPPGPEMMNMGGAMYPQQMNMGGGIYPQYAREGKYLEDEADELRQMIMEGSRAGAGAAKREGRDPRFRDYQPEGMLKGTFFDYVPDPIQTSSYLMDLLGVGSAEKGADPIQTSSYLMDLLGAGGAGAARAAASQGSLLGAAGKGAGRSMSDRDMQEDKRFRDYQPEYEGLPENYQGNKGLMGKIRSLIPDAFQMNEYIADKRGVPSISDRDADELRQTLENRRFEEEMEEILSLRRDEMLLERALADPDANDPEQVAMRERGRTQAAERARAYRSR